MVFYTYSLMCLWSWLKSTCFFVEQIVRLQIKSWDVIQIIRKPHGGQFTIFYVLQFWSIVFLCSILVWCQKKVSKKEENIPATIATNRHVVMIATPKNILYRSSPIKWMSSSSFWFDTTLVGMTKPNATPSYF